MFNKTIENSEKTINRTSARRNIVSQCIETLWWCFIMLNVK